MKETFIKIILSLVIIVMAHTTWGQEVAKFKLSDEELPAAYKPSDKLMCQSIQATVFYDKPEIYSSFLGEIKNKSFQSFESKGERGSILYFEYEDDFKGEAFIAALLWGGSKKPTKEHPEEYMVNGKYLIIWSFPPKSELKKISKVKVEKAIKS